MMAACQRPTRFGDRIIPVRQQPYDGWRNVPIEVRNTVSKQRNDFLHRRISRRPTQYHFHPIEFDRCIRSIYPNKYIDIQFVAVLPNALYARFRYIDQYRSDHCIVHCRPFRWYDDQPEEERVSSYETIKYRTYCTLVAIEVVELFVYQSHEAIYLCCIDFVTGSFNTKVHTNRYICTRVYE